MTERPIVDRPPDPLKEPRRIPFKGGMKHTDFADIPAFHGITTKDGQSFIDLADDPAAEREIERRIKAHRP